MVHPTSTKVFLKLRSDKPCFLHPSGHPSTSPCPTLQRTLLAVTSEAESLMLELLGYVHEYVTGSEKRGHFAQNANFYHFSNCHHAKAFRALGFPLALQIL